jgi:GNAT superfamily N-acetyltransferase
MKDGRPSADDVVLGTEADRDHVLGWLEREFTDGVNGFWYNRGIVAKAHADGDFYVIKDGDEAVAFQVGHYGADIINVRKDRQGEGFGTAPLEASVARACRDNVNVLDVECAPRSSLAFWEKHGFERRGGGFHIPVVKQPVCVELRIRPKIPRTKSATMPLPTRS